MAYPTIAAPYGLQPVGLIGGQGFVGSTRLMNIASGYAANIFKGDLVLRVADGTIEKDTGTATATPVGVFMGCTYTDPGSNQKVFKQYFPTGTVASDIQAYVIDDPDCVFKVVSVSGTTVVNGYGQTIVGNNCPLVQNAGNTTSGNSKVAINGGSAATTNTLPIRVIDYVPDTATGADAYVEWLVKVNFGMHQYNEADGV
jgi:hypothetical protein